MMENPMNMDDAGYPHDFGNLHMVNQLILIINMVH